MSLHCHNAVAKKAQYCTKVLLAVRAIIPGNVDRVAVDFNAASWRRKIGPEQHFDSALEEALKDAKLPCSS